MLIENNAYYVKPNEGHRSGNSCWYYKFTTNNIHFFGKHKMANPKDCRGFDNIYEYTAEEYNAEEYRKDIGYLRNRYRPTIFMSSQREGIKLDFTLKEYGTRYPDTPAKYDEITEGYLSNDTVACLSFHEALRDYEWITTDGGFLPFGKLIIGEEYHGKN